MEAMPRVRRVVIAIKVGSFMLWVSGQKTGRF
jgi:hypothetical protein